MIKVLILCYDFPPYISVGGLRPYNWYQNLYENGVYPVVVTRNWDSVQGDKMDYISPSETSNVVVENSDKGTIIKTPFKPHLGNRLLIKYGEKRFRLIRKFIAVWYEFLQYVFPIGPKIELYKAADNYIKGHNVDCIIATGDPFVLFKYGKKLSAKHHLPWVADYRDPWSQDRSIRNNKIFQSWCAFNEKRIVSDADEVVTVSEYFKNKITSLVTVKRASLIYNGYDLEQVKRVKEINQSGEKLSIAYIGTIYDSHPLDSLFYALNQFIQEVKQHSILLKFYGTNKQELIEELIDSKYSELKDCIRFFPKMKNELLLKKIAKDNVFLLFNDPIIGTKIYDYIGLKRKILYCYTDDEESRNLINEHYLISEFEEKYLNTQENMLMNTQTGIFVQNGTHLKEILKELCKEFAENGEISCKANNTDIYAREHQTKKLAALIKKIVNS
jgi:hypothetical protein